MDRKEGFLCGLKSRKSVALISSSAGLKKINDPSVDHTYPNVLLEYQTALNEEKAIGVKDYFYQRLWVN